MSCGLKRHETQLVEHMSAREAAEKSAKKAKRTATSLQLVTARQEEDITNLKKQLEKEVRVCTRWRASCCLASCAPA